MSYDLLHLTSLDELGAVAPLWDDLWQRSKGALPTASATLIAHWCRFFAPTAAFHALVVRDEQHFVAALPLVRQRWRGLLDAAGLPANQWATGGDLLIDGSVVGEPVIDRLVAGLRDIPWPLVWLEPVSLDAPQWRDLQQACRRADMACHPQLSYQSALIAIVGQWTEYRRGWSRNHRQNLSRHQRQLERRGELRLAVLRPRAADEVAELVKSGFEVEHRSWKGAHGGSVLSQPGLLEFFTTQAISLAASQQLELSFLELAGQPIAFQFGMAWPDRYYAVKAGYDEAFARYSPGQVLQGHLIEDCFRQPERRWIDCMGPINDALRQWRPRPAPIGRMTIAPRGPLGRCLLQAYRLFSSPAWQTQPAGPAVVAEKSLGFS